MLIISTSIDCVVSVYFDKDLILSGKLSSVPSTGLIMQHFESLPSHVRSLVFLMMMFVLPFAMMKMAGVPLGRLFLHCRRREPFVMRNTMPNASG